MKLRLRAMEALALPSQSAVKLQVWLYTKLLQCYHLTRQSAGTDQVFSFFKRLNTKIPSHVLPRVLPRVFPLAWFESYGANIEKELGQVGAKDIFFIPYEANLGIGFCLENNKSLTVVRHEDVQAWKTSPEEVLQVACKNLEKKNLLECVSPELSVWQSTMNNNCDSGIMVCKKMLKNLNLAGYPIVFFLAKDSVLLTHSESPQGMAFCMKTILDYVQEYQELITSDIYMLKDNQWIVIEIEGESEIAQAYRRLASKR